MRGLRRRDTKTGVASASAFVRPAQLSFAASYPIAGPVLQEPHAPRPMPDRFLPDYGLFLLSRGVRPATRRVFFELPVDHHTRPDPRAGSKEKLL